MLLVIEKSEKPMLQHDVGNRIFSLPRTRATQKRWRRERGGLMEDAG
jgi:hypothetical protein